MAVITGNGGSNTLNGTSGIDIVLGLGGNDTLYGMGGSDLLDGGAGNDILDGGAGSDIVYGGAGNDILVFKASENVGACDLYVGGAGTDTLRLILTSAEATAAASDIAAFKSFLTHHTSLCSFLDPIFTFQKFGLTVSGIEKLEIVISGGDTAPRVTPNTASVGEDGPAFSFNLLTGASDSDGPSPLAVQGLSPSVTGSGGRTLNLGTHYSQSGSTLALTAAGFAALNSLAQGETEQFAFNYRVSDGSAATADTLTLTVTGANDPVTITSGPQGGSVVEGTHSVVTGTILFNDVDLSDGHTARASGGGKVDHLHGKVGELTVTEAPGAAGGSVSWQYDFSVGKSGTQTTQELAEGETTTDTFTVTIDDGHGSDATQDVVITITGINDPVAITGGVSTGTVVEDTTLSATGTLSFSDPDLSDSHLAAFSVPPGTKLNDNFSLDPISEVDNAVNGSVTWHYNIDEDEYSSLSAGQTRTETYTVRIADGHGSTATQDVVITIMGTNDPVIVTSGDQTGAVVEDGTLSASGTITFIDADLNDTYTVTSAASPSNTTALGAFTLDTTNGFPVWHYDLDNAAAQALAGGQVVTETYTVTIDDGNGSTASQNVVITITGADEPLLQVTSTPFDETLNDISADGRYVTYAAPGNGSFDVFWKNVATGEVAQYAGPGVEDQLDSHISGDGQHIVFTNDAAGESTIVVWSPETGSSIAAPVAGSSFVSDISDDGTKVAFTNVTLAGSRVVEWDLTSNHVATVGSSTQATSATISGDGRYVAYEDRSFSFNPNESEIVLTDVAGGTTTRITTNSLQGTQSMDLNPSISADGNFVAFQSSSTAGLNSDIFLFDRIANTLTQVSGAGGEDFLPSISGDGRYVAYNSVVAGETDIYVWDRTTGDTAPIALPGVQRNPSISTDGHYILFEGASDGSQFDIFRIENPLFDGLLV